MKGAPPAFNPRVVLGIVVFGAAAFLATLYFIAAGQTSGGSAGSGHAIARGLDGYAALVRLLEEEGHEVRVSRSAASLDEENLLVLAPPHNADGEEIAEIVSRRRYAGPTILVLPKWIAFGIPARAPVGAEDGWVYLADARPPQWVEDFEGRYATGLAPLALDGDGAAHWQMGARRGAMPDPGNLQVLEYGTVIPLVTAAEGSVLAGYYDDGGYYPVLDEAAGLPRADPEADDLDTDRWNFTVVADPDLFNNYGMADRERAALAHALIDTAMEGQDMPIVFDVTLNGLGANRSLLTLAFTPPFLAATLCLLLALAIVGWRAFRRFGPPLAEARAIAFGKGSLVANSAAFTLRTGRLHLLTAPYARAVRQRIADALHLRRPDDAALDRAIARRLPGAPPFAELAAALDTAGRPQEILRAARALKSLERKLVR